MIFNNCKNFINKYFNFFIPNNEHQLKNTEYDSKDLIHYIKFNNLKIEEINENLIFNQKSLVTIQTNSFEECSYLVNDSLDVFCTTYKNDKSIEFIYYNNKITNFIEFNDDLCYGQYLEGMEFTEGNLRIDFDKITDDDINKITVGIGLYDNEKINTLNLSNSFIKDFIITIIQGEVIYYLIKENSFINDNKFCNFLSFFKTSFGWRIGIIEDEYKSVEDFYNLNFNDNKK